jgi:hypothetical protein
VLSDRIERFIVCCGCGRVCCGEEDIVCCGRSELECGIEAELVKEA